MWADGNRDAALRLEELWSRLAEELPFTLVCGYPSSAFACPEDGEPFRRICDAHSHVVPAESYSSLDARDDRQRAIARLQQRSRSLDTEKSRRESAEADLRRQQQEMADFFENAPIAFHWVDAHGIIVQANRAELALLGYTAAEYVGRPVAHFHVDPAALDDILRRLKAGETLHDYEARLRCKDGSIKHVLIDSNVLWEDGRFVHTRCSTRDVTRLKQTEQALRAAVADAEIANRAKDEFLSVVTHELRTPLAAILAG